jgi:hypothetical protein
MFAIVKNGQIEKYIQPNTVFHVDWVEYDAGWIAQASDADKAAIGLVDVVYGQRAEERFYWVGQLEPVYNEQLNVVEINYAVTPKELDSVKANLIAQTNQTAYTMLLPTDWMVVKSVETGTAVPAEWSAWRQAIRAEAQAYVAQINACEDVDALVALAPIEWSKDPNSAITEVE